MMTQSDRLPAWVPACDPVPMPDPWRLSARVRAAHADALIRCPLCLTAAPAMTDTDGRVVALRHPVSELAPGQWCAGSGAPYVVDADR